MPGTFISPVFREMFALPTKGGPIGLPETAPQIRLVLDKLTDRDDNDKDTTSDIIAAIAFARRFQFKGAISLLTERLYGILDQPKIQNDAPLIFAFACQTNPIDCRLAQAALYRFEDEMLFDDNVYRSVLDYSLRQGRGHASPRLDNLRPAYLESLGVIGALSYSKALDQCRRDTLAVPCEWDWTSVPRTFAKHVKLLSRRR